MNSLIPTAAQYDAHFAHRCVDCRTPFGKSNEPAGDCEDGSLCEECNEAREKQTKEDQ